MSLARFSVSRPVAVTMRIAALVLLGAICLTKLPIDLLPKISLPIVAVNTAWPNVAPEEMETQVTRIIEQAVSSAPNVYQVSSTSSLGQSTVRVQFNWGTDIGQAAVDVMQLVQRARNQLPNDPTLQVPSVFKYDPSQLPILIMAASGIDDPVKLRTILVNEIGPMIESADGVAAATITGGDQRSIIVDVDPKKLQAYNLSLDDISQRLSQENINQPAGIAKEGKTELTIRAIGYFDSPQDAARVPVGNFAGKVVTVGDIATIRDSHQETRILTRLNGKSAVGVIITKQSDANTVATAENVRQKILDINRLYPDIKFGIAYNQAGFISNSIHDLMTTAMIGATLAIIILLFFLRNVRSTLVVAMSIPVSIISTFALLYFCGFTLNTISLSGLALATGLIVDDAVVVLENIFRHIERDKRTPVDAAVSASNEIISAVVASTLTIIVVFIPLFFIKGQAGQTFSQFALVVIFSISISLLDAATVVPMLASRLIKDTHVHDDTVPNPTLMQRFFNWSGSRFNALDTAYRRGLKWAIHHRKVIIGFAAVTTLASLLIVPMIGSEMLPQTDSGDFNVNIKYPVGTALTVTNAGVRQAEKILMDDPDVETVFSAAGTNLGIRGATSAQTSYQGSASVRLKDNRRRKTQDVIKDLQRKLASIAGARIIVTPYDLVSQILTGNATNMEVDVFGQNLTALTSTAKAVMERLRTVPGLESVDLGVQDATPELQWKVDRRKAQLFGLNFSDIANVLTTSTSGKLSSYYQENGFQYPIYVQMPEDERKSVDSLFNLPLSTSSGKQVLLGQVAQPVYGLGPNQVTRQDRQRFISVTGRLQDRPESEVQADITKSLSAMSFTQGTYWSFGTQQKRRAEEFSGLGLAVFLAIALIYMLLASQFESFVYPLIVLTSVPLCAVGVVLALFLTGRNFGLTAFIGLLMLIGIVVKNGILLVDYTNRLRGRGMPRDEAILTAGPTRLRPILMTSCAAVLGMFPLALALGRGSETQAPLATAVIGGLITSTVLTLFVVPVVYTLFDDLARRRRKDDRDLAQSSLGPGALVPLVPSGAEGTGEALDE